MKASLNHVFLGDISAWMFNNLVGISPAGDQVGFTNVIVKPLFSKELNWAEGYYRSLNGLISSRWERKNNKISLQLTVPQNTTASVIANGKTQEVGPGKYVFDFPE